MSDSTGKPTYRLLLLPLPWLLSLRRLLLRHRKPLLLGAQHHRDHLSDEQRTYGPAQVYSSQVHADRQGGHRAAVYSTRT